MSRKQRTKTALWLAACLLAVMGARADNELPPLWLAAGTIDASDSSSLGLAYAEGATTATVFSPNGSSNCYNNGAVLAAFKDKLYCMWQTSGRDEDAPDTQVVFSQSSDNGLTWTQPDTLAAATEELFCTSGGWWADGDTLVAFINTWELHQQPESRYVRYTKSADGTHWSLPESVRMADGTRMNALLEQDLHQQPGGRIITAAHFTPGMRVCPIYTDHPSATGGWKRADFTPDERTKQTRQLEPSTYRRRNGSIVMVFRDQNSSFRKMAATSNDNGTTWSRAKLTNVPDARTKQCAGNLPGGTAYLVGCPVSSKQRKPLAVLLSDDGFCFNRAWLLRNGSSDLPLRRYEGKAKTLGYNYPKAIVANGFLFVAYSVNKEDVVVTRIPLTSLESASSE